MQTVDYKGRNLQASYGLPTAITRALFSAVCELLQLAFKRIVGPAADDDSPATTEIFFRGRPKQRKLFEVNEPLFQCANVTPRVFGDPFGETEGDLLPLVVVPTRLKRFTIGDMKREGDIGGNDIQRRRPSPKESSVRDDS